MSDPFPESHSATGQLEAQGGPRTSRLMEWGPQTAVGMPQHWQRTIHREGHTPPTSQWGGGWSIPTVDRDRQGRVESVPGEWHQAPPFFSAAHSTGPGRRQQGPCRTLSHPDCRLSPPGASAQALSKPESGSAGSAPSCHGLRSPVMPWAPQKTELGFQGLKTPAPERPLQGRPGTYHNPASRQNPRPLESKVPNFHPGNTSFPVMVTTSPSKSHLQGPSHLSLQP